MRREPHPKLVLIVGLLTLFSCASGMGPPHINTLYIGPGDPVPRPDSARVELFLETSQPEREFIVIGQVEILTELEDRTVQNMLEYAMIEACRIGGEALINIRTATGPETEEGSTSYPIYNLVTGKIVGYGTYNQTSRTRTLKADIIKWKNSSGFFNQRDPIQIIRIFGLRW